MKARGWTTRAHFRAAPGVLLVLRDPPPPPPPVRGQPPMVPGNPAEGEEILLALADDGHALVLAGHVDLGTGIATARAGTSPAGQSTPLGAWAELAPCADSAFWLTIKGQSGAEIPRASMRGTGTADG